MDQRRAATVVGGSNDTSNMSSDDAVSTVQVPVSLIEGHAAFLDRAGYTATANQMRALLSQPTPTAVLTGGIGYPVHEAARREDEHARNLAPATPPSIADMVPGTTFVANPYSSDIPSRFRVAEEDDLHPQVRYKLRESQTGGGWHAWSIDPSTIRDVTPPTPEEPRG